MPIKNILNNKTDKIAMALDSASHALTVSSVVNPVNGVIGGIVNLISLPFHAYNNDLLIRQINIVISEFNKLETKVNNIEALTEDEKSNFLLNEYKFFDYVLKEKMKEKIVVYAKIFSNSINSRDIFTEDDFFDLKMDIINSLRLEDIKLCKQIIEFLKTKTEFPLAYEFIKEDLECYIVSSTNCDETLNNYALKHLVSLGLLNERYATSAEFEDSENVVLNDRILSAYCFTQRFKMIYEVVMKND